MFIISSLFDIIGTAVGEAQISYKYLLAARILQGFSTSAYESLIVATVGDLYFVHQRGLRVSLINFILNSASSLASIICGVVFADLGWLWLFHLFQIFCIIQFVALFLFCPETTYLRDTKYETDLVKNENVEKLGKEEKFHVQHREADDAVSTATVPLKKTFGQSLAVFTGVYSPDNILKYFFGPLITLLNPAACYAVITSGLLNSWYVGSAIILSGIFSGPPWNFGPAQIGYLGAGPFVGGMIASIIVGWGSDPVVKWMTRRNGGV